MDKKLSLPRLYLELALSLFVLGLLVLFSYAKFVEIPYAGIRYEPDGRIVQVFVTSAKEAPLKLDDKLLEVGSVSWDEYKSDSELVLFDGAKAGQMVPLIIQRNGQTLSIPWRFPGFNQAELLERINSEWWWSYIFWFAGMVTIFVVRPRNVHMRLLITFFFLTSLWLSAGSLSTFHIWHGAIVLRGLIWLCVPVYLHLHWSFPEPLGRIPASVLWAFYLLSAALVIAEVFQMLPKDAFYFGFLLAAAGSVLLLLGHYIFKPKHRFDVRLLAVAVLVILIPPILYIILEAFDILSPLAQGGALLGFPALPGAYFFATYRRQLRGLETRLSRLPRLYLYVVLFGFLAIILLSVFHRWTIGAETTFATGLMIVPLSLIMAVVALLPFFVPLALRGTTLVFDSEISRLEIRANRLLSPFLFVIALGIFLTIPIILAEIWLQFPGSSTLIGLVAAFVASLITLFGYSPTRRFIELRLLGIPLSPDHLVDTYSERITTSLDQKSLVQLLQEELLPSLLVRQSALFQIDAGGMKQFIMLGIMETQIPNAADIPNLLSQAGRNLSSTADIPEHYAWIRLILPLQVSGKTIGFWLFGRRDPDDFYALPEISLLETLANQTAIALVNIEQADRLHTLYQANIEWHEEERSALARELHDDVLGQLAVLATQSTTTDSPEFQENYQLVTSRLRGMVTNLRPAMLQYGLSFTLEECVDELSMRIDDGSSITLEVPRSDARYDSKVEEHLYRIVQQACENAMRHAHADQIRVFGNLDPSHVHLTIEDDGVGFDQDKLDFNTLLTEKHFGLAGMFERADLISADLEFDSTPGEGTKISISWCPESTAK